MGERQKLILGNAFPISIMFDISFILLHKPLRFYILPEIYYSIIQQSQELRVKITILNHNCNFQKSFSADKLDMKMSHYEILTQT